MAAMTEGEPGARAGPRGLGEQPDHPLRSSASLVDANPARCLGRGRRQARRSRREWSAIQKCGPRSPGVRADLYTQDAVLLHELAAFVSVRWLASMQSAEEEKGLGGWAP